VEEVNTMALPIRRREDRSDQPARWLPAEPFAPFEDVYQRMGQLMRGLGEDFGRRGWWSMPIDIEETDDAYLVEVDVPGVSRDDLTLDWNDRQLTIHGEVKERDRKGYLRQQSRHVGRFDYSFTLPGDVDGDRIEASLADGVLTIKAPKAEGARARRIDIGTAQSRG
jgi:HSP20 family protein